MTTHRPDRGRVPIAADAPGGLPFLTPDEHVPCIDHAQLFTLTSKPQPHGQGNDRILWERRTAVAKDICRPCPARPDCYTWALTHREIGVWGGTTTTERALTNRRRRKATP